MSQNLEYQVRQNTIALQRIIDEAKKFSELDEELSTLSGHELVAIEKNGVVKSVRSNMIGGVSGYLGNIPSTFKTVAIDFDAPGTDLEKLTAEINAMPNYPLQNGYMQWFRVARAVVTNGTGFQAESGGPSFAVISDFYLLTRKVAPVSGVASIGTGGTELLTMDVTKIVRIDSRTTEPNEFNLGNIGADEVWESVNASGPRSTPNHVTILFRAIQNSDDKLWLYIGSQEEVGVGFAPVGVDDFREINASTANTPPPAVFTFHEYDDIDAMEAGQANQTAGDLILVKDAGADTNITFEVGETRKQAMYKRKGSAATEDIADYLLVAVPYGNGGGTGIYAGASPTTRTVGGLNSGTNILGKTYDELFESMLAEYVAPSISSFSMVGQNSPIEVGTAISGNKNFSFGFSQSGNVANNTIKIIDVTDGNNVLATGLPKTSPQSVDVGSVAKTTATDNVWRIEAESTKGATISRTMEIEWQHRYWFGGSATDVDTSTKVRALAMSGLDSGGTNNVNVVAGTAHTEFYFFVHNSRKINTVLDTSALNADITSAYVLVGTMTVKDAGGNDQTCKKYKLTLAAAYGSNHTHRITLTND